MTLDAPVEFDIFGHIEFGLSGSRSDSIMFPILAFLWKFSDCRVFLIALVLTIFSILSIFLTYFLLKNQVENISKRHLYLLSFICNIYMPIHVPVFNASPYAGMLGFNVWHNSTYIAMKPFAVLSIILFFKLIKTPSIKSISIAKFIYFSGSLFITSLFKLSFAFGFIPCFLIIIIMDFIEGKRQCALKYILFGATVLPTVLLMIWQKTQLFDQTNEIGFEFLKAWMIYADSPLISLILSLAFPIVVLIFNFKDVIKDKVYRFSWIFAVFNVLIFAFLYESGPRIEHGNFGWGAHFAVGILFIISIYKLLEKIKNVSKFRLAFISAILGMHILCGVNYITRFLSTNAYL